MNNSGNFNNGPPTALMTYPFPIQNAPQHPSLMEQSFINSTPQHFQQHQPRFYNQRPTMSMTKPEKRKQEILTCDTCGIEVNSQQMMDAHIRGQKHIKKMKLKTVSAANPSINQSVDTTCVEIKPTIPTTTTTTTESVPSNEQSLSTPVKPPPPTTTTSLNEKSVLQLLNELAKFNKVNSQYDLIKETGPAHCKNFEVRLTLGEETYTGSGTSIKRAQQVAAEQALATTTLKKPEAAHRGTNSVRATRATANRGLQTNIRHQYPTQQIRNKSYSSIGQQQTTIINNENIFQTIINNKINEIVEDENTIILIQRFVDEIERALKSVSDKIMEQSKLNNISVVPKLPDNVNLNDSEQSNEDPTESFRMLKGAMKVSTLAMRLFLHHDNEYSLVLICANKPTRTLLNEICQELTIGLNAQAIAAIDLDSNEQQSSPITYQVQAHINDACLTIQCSVLPKHTIRIMLTSPVFRSENFLNFADETRQKIAELNPDPNDMLDKAKCLQAAAEIRHSNWFTHCMLENNSNLIILQLLRYLQMNKTPLSHMNLWCLTLLVHKCQIQPPNSIINLCRSVFSCLSSGILLPNNLESGIIDPCEKEMVDAAAYLTNEQRFDLTRYAQYVLRLIAFEKFDKIFCFQSNSSEQLSIDSTLKDHQIK